MKWKAFFERRGIREGICGLLIAVMLLGLCYPTSAFQVADLENPMQDVEVKDVLPFEAGLHTYLKQNYAPLLARIEESKRLEKEDQTTLATAIAEYKQQSEYASKAEE